MGELDGKVAIVTGSGRGIGQQVALRLARDGAAVVVNDRDDAPARETIALVEGGGGRPVTCNGGGAAKDNPSSATAAVTGMPRTLAQEWGRYAVTVHCVAFGYIPTRLTKPLAEG